MLMLKKKILFWGGKSQTRILIEYLNKKRNQVVAIVDPSLKKLTFSQKEPFINTKKNFDKFLKKANHCVDGIGGHYGLARTMIFDKLYELTLNPFSIIHESSIIDKSCKIGKGVQIMQGVNVNCFSEISDYTILNTGCTIDHECIIGRGVHVMGKAYIGGRVIIEDFATIGSNATIFPNIRIGNGAFVGAGAVVRKNVKNNEIVTGNPAKFLKKNKLNYNLWFLK